MGDVWILDRAISLEVILGALEILEEDLRNTESAANRLEICLNKSALIIVGYTAALRGEEIPQIDIGMMRKYWNEGKSYSRKSHVPLTLVRRFKQTSGATKVYIQPMAPVTSLGIQVQLWLGCTIQQYHDAGVETGPMFRVVPPKKRIQWATVSHLDSLLHDVLKRLQHWWPDVIGSEIKIEEEYSVHRSLQRGATTKAQNRKIPQQVIKTNNRWKKHIRSQGVLPSMMMIERYSNAKASIEAVIEFSELM